MRAIPMWAPGERTEPSVVRLAAVLVLLVLLGTSVARNQPTALTSVLPVSKMDSNAEPPLPANISDNPAYKDNLTLTAAFEAKMQFPDGGIDEAEDYHYLNTDNTLEAVWIWSRYYTLTRDNRYFGNVTAAWNYSEANPAWLEPDSGKVYSCAWALKAELEFRLAYGNESYLGYAQTCADFIVSRNGWEPVFWLNDWGKNDIRGLAAGNLYEWALSRGNDTLRRKAIDFGNQTQAAITANPAWLSMEDWALAGGVAYWGVVHSTFREYPNATWAEQYGALLPTNVTGVGSQPGNSQCGWYAWYALGHYAAWEAAGNTTHLNFFLGMVAWLIMQDGDRDGGIPTNFGEPDDTDESWVTSYRALDLASILRPWLGSAPDPPTLTSAGLSGQSRENVTLTWRLSPQDNVIGDVVRYDVYRGNPYNTSGGGYLLTANVSSGATSFTDHITPGDPNQYFYSVKAVDSEWYVSRNSNQAGRIVQHMFGHWGHTLLSSPFIVTDDSVDAILSQVQFDYVRAYDASNPVLPWSSYAVGRSYQSLTRLPMGVGFWANVSAPAGIVFGGLIAPQVTVSLKAGWNLIGYCSMTSRTVGETLAGIPWMRVEVYSPSAPYYLHQVGPAEPLFVGEGFWVEVPSAVQLVFAN